jgi:hypothetical protein
VSAEALLLVLAFACFVLATFNVNVAGLNLVALGLALWVLTLILGALEGLSSLVVVLLVVLLVVLVIVVVQRFPRSPAPPR